MEHMFYIVERRRAREALDRAEIADADRELARAWLPQLRAFLRDMLVVQRQEFERDFMRDDPADGTVITADDLRAAQRELEARCAREVEEAWAESLAQGEGEAGAREAGDRGQVAASVCRGRRAKAERRGCTFLVCPGEESEALLGIDTLRGVRQATGLRFARLLDATRHKLRVTFGRQRGFGKPIEYLHLGLRAAEGGLELVDGTVDAAWLNKHLAGVRVVLLTRCASHGLGAALAAPYVVTVDEGLPTEEAAALAEQFWLGIGGGAEPGAALAGALAGCGVGVEGGVVRHW